jgi:hypothetical protein
MSRTLKSDFPDVWRWMNFRKILAFYAVMGIAGALILIAVRIYLS